MIPKDQKFNMRTQFLEFKKRANVSRTKNLSIYYEPSKTKLLAVVIPKKTLKKATARNALKRILKKILLDNINQSTVVVTTHPTTISKDDFKAVATQLENKLKEINA